MRRIYYPSLAAFFALSAAQAGYTTNYQNAPGSIVWKEPKHWCSTGYLEIKGYSDYRVGFRLNVPHYSQPTNNTCGATALSMIKSYEGLKNSGILPPQPDIVGLYDLVNTDGASGLITTELKAAIIALGIFDGKYREVGSDDIDIATKDNFWSYSPMIIYGNTYFGSAGGHYYVATGVIYCDDTLKAYNKCSYRGLYINDSVHKSPAYPSPTPPVYNGSYVKFAKELVVYLSKLKGSVGAYALSPDQFFTVDELKAYWKPTGSTLPWERRHYYIKKGV